MIEKNQNIMKKTTYPISIKSRIKPVNILRTWISCEFLRIKFEGTFPLLSLGSKRYKRSSPWPTQSLHSLSWFDELVEPNKGKPWRNQWPCDLESDLVACSNL